MEKTDTPEKFNLKLSFIGFILAALVVLFAGVLGLGWRSSLSLRQKVAANAAVMNIDSSALIELERLRNFAESQVTNSRAYFLLGSKSLFEKQKDDKQRLSEGVAKFVKENQLPQIEGIATAVENIEKQEQDLFDQAMAFREKLTESKIVAQFYQSKTAPLLAQLNEQFDKIAKLQHANLEAARTRASQAGVEAQAQIPKDMLWLMSAVSAIFLCASLLVVWLLVTRRSQQRVRDRLYVDAQKSANDRDEVLAAVAYDLKEPVANLEDIAKDLAPESSELIRSVVDEINSAVSDIVDQKRADMGALTLRLEQLPLSGIFDEAQAMLAPLAKKRDITLQFDAVNQSVMAYVDRERVMRVLSNLIGNAIKFSPKNSRVQVKVKSDAQFANISVIDNGPGIAESRLATIFESFWQAPRTADQGPGVGLAVVKTIIEAHGGSVRAEKSLIGGGSAFTFSLPRRRPVGAPLKKPSSSSSVRRVATRSVLHENDEGPRA